MNNKKLVSEYYKEDGGCAKIYRVITGMDGDNSFFSITFKDADGVQIATEDFKFKALNYVEDAAENWIQGIKEVDYV